MHLVLIIPKKGLLAAFQGTRQNICFASQNQFQNIPQYIGSTYTTELENARDSRYAAKSTYLGNQMPI